MSRKTLNARNLETLGAARLAALVMDLVQGSAALQRQARMALSATQGRLKPSPLSATASSACAPI